MRTATATAERRTTLLRQATVVSLLVCSALVLVLGGHSALVATKLGAARDRIEDQDARRAELARSWELASAAAVAAEPAEQLSAEDAFAVLATSIGDLAKQTGITVRTLRQVEHRPRDSKLRTPPGCAQVTAELIVDTSYQSTLELLHALDTMAVAAAPIQLDLASASVSSLDAEPELALRLLIVAQGLSVGQGG